MYRSLAILILVLLGLITLRMTRTANIANTPDGVAYEEPMEVRNRGSFSVKNYASEKAIGLAPPASAPYAAKPQSMQKYEKTAVVNSRTAHFNEDEKRARTLVHDFNAIIQYEHSSGLPGRRESWFYIGVDPDSFDSFYHAVLRIGIILATEVTKEDKTQEYLQLSARRESLRNTLQSLRSLQSRGNDISDLIKLNDRILEAENNLHQLGVELGSFEQEREFCTVKVSLTEKKPTSQPSFSSRLWSATIWALPTLFGIALLILLLLTIAYFFHVVLEKYKGGNHPK